jgi:predicted nucleic acid-binding protein
MRRVALDTSVVVPAVLSWHEHHARAAAALRTLADRGSEVVLPAPALLEAYAVITRLPPPWRTSARIARELLVRNFRQREVAALDAADVWGLLDDAIRDGLAGGVVYDAHVLACARRAGATALLTMNARDFARLDCAGIEIVVPA